MAARLFLLHVLLLATLLARGQPRLAHVALLFAALGTSIAVARSRAPRFATIPGVLALACAVALYLADPVPLRPALAALVVAAGAAGVAIGMQPLSKNTARVAVAAVAAIVTCSCVELWMRMHGPADVYLIRPIEGSTAADPYVRGDRLKWTYAPGFRGRFVHPEYHGETFAVNSDGFRDREWEKGAPFDGERVLALGDSYTVGLGVEGDENYASLLERALVQRGRHVRVYNAGVAGYGPGEQMLLLEDLLPRLRPAIVIALFYDGNDLDDLRLQFELERVHGRHSLTLPSEVMELTGELGELSIDAGHASPPSPCEWEFWRKTRLGEMVDSRCRPAFLRWGLATPRTVFTQAVLRAMKGGAQDPRIAEDLQLARLTYARMKRACDAAGARLLLLRVPLRLQLSQAAIRKTFETYGAADPDHFDRSRPGGDVLRNAAADGIATLDMLPRLEAVDRDAAPCYFEEGHLNRRGHREVADALADALSGAPARPLGR